MMHFAPLTKSELFGTVSIAALFLISAYLSASYQDVIQTFVEQYHRWGMVVYVGGAALATVVAPVSTMPLVPAASAAWGPFTAALLSIAGWSLGSMVAFWISRRYGYNIVKRFVKLRKIQKYALYLPDNNLFWTVLFMRMVVPADILSYALGLFTTMRFGPYMLATVIGVTPFAFIFAYTFKLSVAFQAITLLLIGTILFFTYSKIQTVLKEKAKK